MFSYDPTNKRCVSSDLRQSVGTVVPTTNPALVLVAANKGICLVDSATGRVARFLGSPEAHLPENRWNDGKCDPRGRLWVGSMNNFGDSHAGALYSFDGEENIVKHLDNISISNGLVWNRAGTKFFYIDTPTLEVKQFDYDAETGIVSCPKPVIRIDAEAHGFPDGCTIDSDDKIWIAMWQGGCVVRFDPGEAEKI